MSPKNAILVLIIMACISFGTLFYLVKARRPVSRVEYGEVVKLRDEKINNEKDNNIKSTSTKEKALKAMDNMKKNNPITEESRQKALDAMANMKNK